MDDEEYRRQFNDKFAKKLKQKGHLTKEYGSLVEVFKSVGMLNEDVVAGD